MRFHRLWPLPAVLLALAPLACGGGPRRPPVHPVQGRVTHNGAPAAGALVVFHPKDALADIRAVRPNGEVDAEGNFRLSSFGRDDGAPAGDYLIAVTWAAPPKPAAAGKVTGLGGEGEAKETADRLGSRYANPNSSGLTATVKPGENQIPPIELK